MKVLLDTHALLWWAHDSKRLSAEARDRMRDPSTELLFSAASSWEIAVKLGIGKLQLTEPLRTFLVRVETELALTRIAVEHTHSIQLAGLPALHRDPFDRMLVAQAQVERVPIVTADARIAQYEVETLW